METAVIGSALSAAAGVAERLRASLPTDDPDLSQSTVMSETETVRAAFPE